MISNIYIHLRAIRVACVPLWQIPKGDLDNVFLLQDFDQKFTYKSDGSVGLEWFDQYHLQGQFSDITISHIT